MDRIPHRLDATELELLKDDASKFMNYDDVEFSGKTFPEQVCKLTNLIRLRVHMDSGGLPACIGNLINLESLDLWFCHLTALPETIGNLVNLKHLKISDNCLERLPESIGDLVNLEILDMGENRNFKQFPRSFFKLKNLKQLKLAFSGVPYLPIINMTKLELLELHQYQLYELDPRVGKALVKQGCTISAEIDSRDEGGDSIWETEFISSSRVDFWCHGGKARYLEKICRSSLPCEMEDFAFVLDVPKESLMDLIKEWQENYNIIVKGDELFFRVEHREFVPYILKHTKRKKVLKEIAGNINIKEPKYLERVEEQLQKEFEIETGKHAIYNGKKTKAFTNWKREAIKKPFTLFKSIIHQSSEEKRAEMIYNLGMGVLNVEVKKGVGKVEVEESEDSDIELGTGILKLAWELPESKWKSKISSFLWDVFKIKPLT